MAVFCPDCSNVMSLQADAYGNFYFVCPACQIRILARIFKTFQRGEA